MGRIVWPIADIAPPASSGMALDEIPTTLRRCMAADASAGESMIISGYVPHDYRGDGTLKLKLPLCANTTTSTHGVAVDVVTEFVTPDAGTPEAANADSFDATPDTGTVDLSTVAYGVESITVTLTPATTPSAGDLYRVKVTRNVADAADDLTSDAFFLLDGLEIYEEV